MTQMPTSFAELLLLREAVDVEVKKAQGQNRLGKLSTDFWPSYSALANINGGVIAPDIWGQVRGDLSNLLNNSLHWMFLLVGEGERAGAEIPKSLGAWSEQPWRFPNLAEGVNLDAVTFKLSMKSLMLEAAVQALAERFRPEFKALTPDERRPPVQQDEVLVPQGQATEAVIALGKQASRETVQEVILLACTADYRTLVDLAERLGRSPETLRSHYLPDMVTGGQLFLLYPDTPTRKGQAYRAVEPSAGQSQEPS